MINIYFEKTNGQYTFKDALNLTQAEVDALGEEGIEALKQQRFDNWLAIITAPPVEETSPAIES
jgi:oligoendopeptidase F